MSHYIQKRKKIHAEIEALKKELQAVNHKISEDELLENWSILDGIESLNGLYENGDRAEMLRVVSAMKDNLQEDKNFNLSYSPSKLLEEEFKNDQFVTLDKRFSKVDLPYGHTCVIGARPGIGKTTFACNLSWNNIKNKKHTVYFAIEPARHEVYIKILQVEWFYRTGKEYSYHDIIKFYKKDAPVRKLMKEFVDESKKYLLIIESSGFTASKISGLYEKSISELGCKPEFVIIDYVQKIKAEHDAAKFDKRSQMISSSEIITEKAKLSRSVFILTSQLNKEGNTKESEVYEEQAATHINLEREIDKHNNNKWFPEVTIERRKGRFSGRYSETIPFLDAAGIIGNLKPMEQPSLI